MELELSEDQELLRATAAKFIEETCPRPVVRALIESETGIPDGYLARAGELGWFAMLVPEELGGGSVSGQGLRDLALIAEERGRGLQPGPFVAMNVAADLLARRGSDEQRAAVLPALVAGESAVAWAVADPSGAWAPGDPIRLSTAGAPRTLRGEAGAVQDAGMADWLLVTAGGEDGLSQFLLPASTPGVSIRPRQGHDLTQRFASVRFDDVEVDPSQLVGELGQAGSDVERETHLALVLSVADTIGAMDVLFEMTRQYALDRIVFGRPIGSFQGLKHQLADMSLSIEAGKAISVAATRAAQEGSDDGLEISRMAKAWVGDTGIDIAQGCFQVFGGIGYTWEHDLHLFLRRITFSGLLYGQADFQREQICVAHGI
jgi:alkylation response protein AidB-like acyl-CoA dehydrogenase